MILIFKNIATPAKFRYFNFFAALARDGPIMYNVFSFGMQKDYSDFTYDSRSGTGTGLVTDA